MVIGLRRVQTAARQCLCGLRGHDALLHFDNGRMSLRCSSCEYETPGWDLRGNDDARVAHDESRVVRMPLVGGRVI